MTRNWEGFGEAAMIFRALRSEQGEEMILERNAFVETVLPRSTLRKLTEEEMNAYRTPFKMREDRWPTLKWPREIPIEGEPADVAAIVESNGRAMSESRFPKLLISGNPGAIIRGRTLDYCRTWKNQTEVTVSGIHFLQEDSPHDIGRALSAFLDSIA